MYTMLTDARMLNDIFKKLNDNFVHEILNDPDFKKLTASGRSANFLKSPESFKIEKNRAIKFGVSYTFAQDFGIKASVPVSALYDWLQFKKYGLDYANDAERKAIAWALHFKIKKSGTFKFKRPTNIYEKATNVALNQFKKDIYGYSGSFIREIVLGR